MEAKQDKIDSISIMKKLNELEFDLVNAIQMNVNQN